MRESDDPAILAIEGDIPRPETAERILGIAAERFGRIDTLVNNAGIFMKATQVSNGL
jgi:NAD(P)-dependent dehydrogenase (short-subunit alcohol dehydrogenase family)